MLSLRNKQNSLSFKVGLGFSTIALVLVSALIVTFLQVRSINTVTKNIASHDLPAIQTTTNIVASLNKQLMQQRLWVTSGDKQYIIERQQIWASQLAPLLIDLQNLISVYGSSSDGHQLQVVYDQIQQLKTQEESLEQKYPTAGPDAIYQFVTDIGPAVQSVRDNAETFLVQHQSELFGNLQQIKAHINLIFGVTLGFLCLGLVLCGIMGLVLSRSITRPIDKLVATTRQLARGDLTQDFTIVGAAEFEILSQSLNNVVETLRSLSHVTENMAAGDYSQRVDIKSEQDLLAITVNQMLENFNQIVNQANAISQGDYSADIEPRSAVDKLGTSLKHMTETLRQNQAETQEQNWLKDGLANFANVMGETRELEILCNQAISEICRYTNAGCGAIFFYNETQQHLNLLGTYALTERNALNNSFKLGEGLVGQAALEHKPILLKNADSLIIASGTVLEATNSVYCLPVLYEKSLIGAIEVAWNHPVNTLVTQYLDNLLPMLASHMQAAYQHKITQQLLQEQKLLAEKLQVQQEELKATNEELEQQAQTLKASEEELRAKDETQRAINAKLEEKTRELTAQKEQIEKTNQALKQASTELEKKAEELSLASKYKSEFLANMSHELRTPLNSLIILAKLLAENKEQNLNQDQVESAQIMLKSGNDLLTLINDILDLAKVEAGKIEVHLSETRLTEIIQTSEANFNHVAKEKGIDFKTELDPGLPAVIYTDEQRVSQVIRNLISNAMKFTEQGYVKLHISRPPEKYTDKLPANKNYLAFAVSDTGIGIPPEKQQLVFEAFQQADGTTSRKYGGTGLGLSISTEFSHLLNGGIYLESEVGKGSIFTLVIPDNCDQLDSVGEATTESDIHIERAATAPSPVAVSAKQEMPGNAQLMIIANENEQTSVLVKLAQQQGLTVKHTTDAETALQQLTSETYSGIIIDLDLQEIDALALLDKIKQSPNSSLIPLMVIGSNEESTVAIQKGAIGYLKKPISEAQLTQALQQIQDKTNSAIRSLLIVEDDVNHLNVIKKLLSRANVTIDTAATGTETLYKLQNNDFDCVILDLGLPDISGQDILKVQQKLGREKQPAIIIYTGQDLSKEDSENLSKYVDSIILKGTAASMERLQEETNTFLNRVKKQLTHVQASQPVVPPAPTPIREPITQNIDGAKILLVDDDMRNVYALSKALKSLGLNILMAANGKFAIETLEKNPDIKLVLMDIMMPVMDGYEAITRIRQISAIKDIPIIAVTAKAMAGDKEKCLQIGASDFMTKPIDLDKLSVALNRWIH
jgi:signal transduction histidine kinase/CheY-like chemotaxis protein